MDNRVIVVTGLYLGWDCVVGVFSGVSEECLRKQFPEGEYVLSDCALETNVFNYEQ